MSTRDLSEQVIYKCPFCVQEFKTPNNSGCKSCSFNVGCTLIKCPYCGYEFPDVTKGFSGKLSSIIGKIIGKKEKMVR